MRSNSLFLKGFLRGGLAVSLFWLAVFGLLWVSHAGGANGGTTTNIEAGVYCRTDGTCLDIGRPLATATLQPTNTAVIPSPTLTPAPSSTPTAPPDAKCWGVVNTDVLRVRAGAGTSYAILGVVHFGDVLALETRNSDGTWYQVYWLPETVGWVSAQYVTLGDGAVCDFGPPVLAWHAVPGANLGEMRISWVLLAGKHIPFGVKAVSDVSLCQAAHDAGGVCIYRSVLPSDCPNVDNPDAVQEARLFLLSLTPYINPALPYASFIEPVNECRYDPELWIWWRDFTLEAVRLADVYHWPPLVVPTFGPGWPELDMMNVLAPALRAVRDSGGLLGLHAYSIYKDASLCAYNQWLSYRHRIIHARLVSLGLGDLDFALTEVARGDGTLTPLDTDIMCYYDAVREDDPFVRFVAFWTAGKVGHWANADLEGHMIQIAQIVQ